MAGEASAVDVVVLETQSVLRAALAALIDRAPGFPRVGAGGRTRRARGAARRSGGCRHGVGSARRKGPGRRAGHQSVPARALILVLTAVSHPSIVSQVLAAGATGYVLTSATTEEFYLALAAVARKENYLLPSLGVELTRWQQSGDDDQANTLRALSAKETDVLRLLAHGHTNAEIAGLTGVSLRTVETHRARLFQKLNLRHARTTGRVHVRRGTRSAPLTIRPVRAVGHA